MPYFYPRPPRGGRPHLVDGAIEEAKISIHALREEGDVEEYNALVHRLDISIHALREEGDKSAMRYGVPYQDFYPRPPRGGRLLETAAPSLELRISIHALREEGDVVTLELISAYSISIHALREEGDTRCCGPC